MTGTVKWFDPRRGYGFISGDDGTDYFVHQREILMDGFRKLRKNETASFTASQGEKGAEARDVRSTGLNREEIENG